MICRCPLKPSVLNFAPLAGRQRAPLLVALASEIALLKAEVAPLLQAPGKALLLRRAQKGVRSRCTKQSLALVIWQLIPFCFQGIENRSLLV